MSEPLSILLIGDLASDVFIQGDCPRLSPEAPVVIFSATSVTSNAGMAGNVLANLQSLGGSNVDVTTLFPDTPSTKIRYVDRKSNQHLLRVDSDVKSPAISVARVVELLDSRTFHAVVLSDYAKGFLTTESMGTIANLCADRHIPTFCDTKSLLSAWSKNLTIVKINQVEYDAHTKVGIEPWKWCKNLIHTQGSEGMTQYQVSEDGRGYHEYRSTAVKAEVKDQVGAGDCALAALTIRYLESGGDIQASMDWANKVGAIAVSKRGVVAVKREEVDHA